MKKILFFILVSLCINFNVYAANEPKKPETPSVLMFENIQDEFKPINQPNYNSKKGSYRIEEYLFRMFKLYRHFDEKFPDKKIDDDLKPEIRKLLPRLEPQEVYDTEDNIRFMLKNYRGIKSLIAKIKEKLLVPDIVPIIVSPDELKLYDGKYIPSKDELIVLYQPLKVLPYAQDKKNTKSVEASLAAAKKKSNVEVKFDELKSNISLLEFKKLPFYNIIYEDPIRGKMGVGEWSTAPKVKTRILSPFSTVGQDEDIKLAINIRLDDGWFIPNNGEKTFKVKLIEAENIKNFELFRPEPSKFYIHNTKAKLNGYNGYFILPLVIKPLKIGEPIEFGTQLEFEICNENLECKAQETTPKFALSNGEQQTTTMHNFITQSFYSLPKETAPSLKLIKAKIYEMPLKGETLKLTFEADANKANFVVFVTSQSEIEFNEPILGINNDIITATISPKNPNTKLEGETFEITAQLNLKNIIRKTITPDKASFFDIEQETLSWWLIWLGFIGGFILNLMPCVFPVLGLKIISITKFGGSKKETVRSAFMYMLLGILSAFMILAVSLLILKSAGYALGWGMQFQSSVFLWCISLALVIFLLQLSGIINLNSPAWVDRLLRSDKYSESVLNYLTGLLLVLLATPCSAPYLGTALGFALAGSMWDIVIIMTSIGCGLALPYLILFIRPDWAKAIPHPGKWLKTLHYFMIIMLLLTLIWILSLLLAQVGAGAIFRVIAYLSIFAILWYLGKVTILEIDKTNYPTENKIKVIKIVKNILWGISIVLFIIATADIFTTEKKQQKQDNILPITIEQQTQIQNYLNDNKAVLVAIGADWCLTCKYNDFVAIDNFKIDNLQKEGKLILLRSNQSQYTNETLQFMEKFSRKALPFYVLYTPKVPEGIVLPEVLTDTYLYQMILEGQYR